MSETSVLVVTGAAATGKSTIGEHLRSRPGLLVIDGDILGRGAAATAGGREDYVDFWRYVLSICREVRSNGLTPLITCICLPDQVIAAAEAEVIHFLALLSEPETVRQRIAARPDVSAPPPEKHVEVDRRLREIDRVPAPHTWATHDVTASDVRATLAAAEDWLARIR